VCFLSLFVSLDESLALPLGSFHNKTRPSILLFPFRDVPFSFGSFSMRLQIVPLPLDLAGFSQRFPPFLVFPDYRPLYSFHALPSFSLITPSPLCDCAFQTQVPLLPPLSRFPTSTLSQNSIGEVFSPPPQTRNYRHSLRFATFSLLYPILLLKIPPSPAIFHV